MQPVELLGDGKPAPDVTDEEVLCRDLMSSLVKNAILTAVRMRMPPKTYRIHVELGDELCADGDHQAAHRPTPTMPQKSTRCWYSPAPQRTRNSIAMTKTLSTLRIPRQYR